MKILGDALMVDDEYLGLVEFSLAICTKAKPGGRLYLHWNKVHIMKA